MKNTKEEIEGLLSENAGCFKIAQVLKKSIKIYFDTLEDSFYTSSGKDFLVKHTTQIDLFLKLAYKVVLREMFKEYTPMKNAIPVALIALGSYGREQLCVYSDIDLMIVYKDIEGYKTKEIIEKMLYLLWDAGLKLGHRVHTVDDIFEASKIDITIKTALIESRFIEGSNFIWMETQNEIRKIRYNNIRTFITLKLEEQALKHKKFPLTMEPNLKDGIGGFRDANLVFWIGKILYDTNNIKSLPSSIIKEEEYKIFRIALEFLFCVRSALHLASKKKEDKLRLDLIPAVSKLLGYEQDKTGHLKFAKKVTASLKIIRLYTTIWVEMLTREYIFPNKEINYLYPKEEDTSFNMLLKELIHKADKAFIAHPTFLKKLTLTKKEECVNEKFYTIVSTIFYQPYSCYILSTLSYASVLKYTIEPIKKVVDLPQFDGYHQYAVDIHSIQCMYYLEHIQDSFIQSLFDALTKEEKALLKLVVFLHDAGKGRKTDHHQVGVTLFKNFALKLKLSPLLIQLGETLILYHTLMSNVAQREDLYSQKTILSFASHFKTKRLLDMIYILTYADMNGVGGDIYNAFSAKLIKTLYKQSVEVLGQTSLLDEASKRTKKELLLKKYPDFLSLTKTQQKKILHIPSNLLFLRYTPQRIIAISKKAFETKEYTYHISNTNHLTIEIIRYKKINLSYLLLKLKNIEVINMDIAKIFNELKYFKIDFKRKADENEISLIENFIHQAFKEAIQTKISMPIIHKKDIIIECNHSKEYALMYIQCQNQKGLLAFIIKVFDEMHLEIITAKVHTLKNGVKDMFLIEKDEKFCDKNLSNLINKLTTKTK